METNKKLNFNNNALNFSPNTSNAYYQSYIDDSIKQFSEFKKYYKRQFKRQDNDKEFNLFEKILKDEFKIEIVKKVIDIHDEKNFHSIIHYCNRHYWGKMKIGNEEISFIFDDFENNYISFNLILDLDKKENIELLEKIKNYFSKKRFRFKKDKTKPYINILIQTGAGLDSIRCEIEKIPMNVELHYGKHFVKVHQQLENELKEGKKGLVLFHGIPGTGKTTYIRYLIERLTQYKDVYFIPAAYGGILADPSFIPFLMQRQNSILVIEDAESVISSRDGAFEGRNEKISNLLNISDGLLSDVLKVQVICTYNVSNKKIDDALFRKGRLIAQHEFKKLNVEEVKALIEHYNIVIPEEEIKEMTLAEIFNYSKELFVSFEKKSTIGFNKKIENAISLEAQPKSNPVATTKANH